MSRSLLRTALELRSPITRLPPTFLLPLGARWLSTTTPPPPSPSPHPSSSSPYIPPTTPPPAAAGSSLEASRAQQTSAEIHVRAATTAAAASTAKAAEEAVIEAALFSPAVYSKPQPTTNGRTPPLSPPPAPKGPIPAKVMELLPLLRAQPEHYITVHIHARPYLVTPGDIVRLPFLMPGVHPGDVLRLNRASTLGSRDLTLRPAQPKLRTPGTNEVAYVDERLFECRAVVVGVESEPMREKEKTKRRNRKVKTIKSKHRFTVLRISELRINSPEEVEVDVDEADMS